MFDLEIQALLICGGVDFYQNPIFTSNECFILDKFSSKLFARMSKKRALAASLITKEKNLWVTGGLDYDTFTPFSSTEHILKNGESVKGPELPLPLVGHTAIAINSTFSMFIGGETPVGGSINYTYYYDHYNQVWFDGPGLKIARYLHGAGIVTDLITKERLVVVTGGSSDGDYYLQSTEVLIDGEWVLGNK